MNRFNPAEFERVIVDEAHHGVASSWREVLEYYGQNPNCKIVGFTATPDRADELALGAVFESVAYRYDLGVAINDGFLVPIRQTSVFVDSLDFSSIRTTAGDLNGADLADLMELEENLHGVVTPTLEIARGRKCLIFAASRIQGERMAEIICRHEPGSAAFVDCTVTNERRRETFAAFHEGRIRYLVNVGIATEGWDGPTVEVVVMARPTKSRSLYAQMVGRGTRPLPGILDGLLTAEERTRAIESSTKPYTEILDFVGNAGRHDLVCVADILGGFSDDAKKRVKKKHADGDLASADMIAALREAEKEIEEEKAAEEERKKRAKIVAGARYSTATSTPFDVFGIKPSTAQGFDRCKKPTPKMLALLQNAGVETEGLTFTNAKQLIGEIMSRRSQGQCTFKQARLLKKYGFDSNMSYREASAVIDNLAKNGWRVPAKAGA